MTTPTWLITWTTYGTWLPGDGRGFVGHRPDDSGRRVIRNRVGDEYDRDVPWLRDHSAGLLTRAPVLLTTAQAEAAAVTFRVTADCRAWPVRALAVMANHVHIVVRSNAEPEDVLRVFKSYASRSLNQSFGAQKWWTASGSTRPLPDDRAVRAATRYVRDQARPLVVEADRAWLLPDW